MEPTREASLLEDQDMSTARHAGYAAVTTIGADLVNGMLTGAASLVQPTTFALPSIVNVAGESIGLNGLLSVNAPSVTFATNPQNLIGVTIGASGTLRLTANGNDLVEVDVTLSTTLQIGMFVDVSPASLAVGIDLSNASVTSVDVNVDFGPPLAAQYNAALQGGPVIAALTTVLRSVPKAALTFVVPGVQGTLSYSFSGVTVSLPISAVTLVPLDGIVGTTASGGFLDIALDVAGFTSGNAGQMVNLITTVGPTGAGFSADQFGDLSFTGDGSADHNHSGVNLASIVNAGFFTSFVNGQLSQGISGVTVQGVTIDSVSLSISSQTASLDSQLPTTWFNCLTVSVNARYIGQGFNFVASFSPVSVETVQPFALLYSMWLVNQSVSSPFLTILNVLLPVLVPWLGVIVDVLIDSTVDSMVTNEVNQNVPGLNLAGFGTLPFPGLNGWNLNYLMYDMAVSSDEIAGYLAMNVVAPAVPAVAPVFSLISAPHALTDPSPIPVTLAISRAGLMDPLLGLRISWTVSRDDTSATVISQDTALTMPALAISIDRWTGDLVYNNTWTVTCEVYRPADALINRHSYFKQTISAGVVDIVDRHRPYVLWKHRVRIHNPVGPGSLRTHHFWTKDRTSCIHRTDVLIRCKAIEAAFSSGYPQETGKTLVEPKLNVPAPQYLDSIASYGTLDTVENWRHGVLCDYCFFGGPSRTEWRVPTAPTPPFE